MKTLAFVTTMFLGCVFYVFAILMVMSVLTLNDTGMIFYGFMALVTGFALRLSFEGL